MSAHRACVLLATLAFVDPILGRFVFTPILPLMRADYGLSIVAAGWLAAANHLGYLAGALTAARIPLTERAALRAGMLVVTASFAPMALPLPVEAWFVVRFVAGVGAAWVFVHAAAWGLRHALAAGRSEWSGWLFVGAGLTLIVSGVICALWTLGGGHAAGAWLANGAILVAILVVVWSRAGDARVSSAAPSRGAPDGAPADGDLWRMVLAYGAAGFGYVAAATFLPVLAQAVLGTDSGYMWFWPMFGLAALASMLIVMRVGGRVDDTAAFRFCVALMALGNLAMAWFDAGWALLFGTVAVGGTLLEARRDSAVAPRWSPAQVSMRPPGVDAPVAHPMRHGVSQRHSPSIVSRSHSSPSGASITNRSPVSGCAKASDAACSQSRGVPTRSATNRL
jgi:predicted MFS family arabinose efflux permease